MTVGWKPLKKYRRNTMKRGLNRMDISKFHKLLRQEVPLEKIARHLHTTVEVLKKFTPERVEAATKRAKKIEEKAVKAANARHETVKAAVAGAVAATVPKDTPPSVDIPPPDTPPSVDTPPVTPNAPNKNDLGL